MSADLKTLKMDTLKKSKTTHPLMEKSRRGIQSIEIGSALLLELAKQVRPLQLKDLAKAAGLTIFAKDMPSDAVTAINAPEGVDGQAIYKSLRVKYGITAAGGQDQLKGKVFRISTMGYLDRFDIITALAAMEMVLKGLGHPITLGSGVARAQALLMAE